ncbi:hypothetical protein COK15_28090 [Bacillus cereus]|uniref:hypothetical protein n=1 Tax=Bacillus cereus TaxID=1396 RepID=UPI000BF6B6B6|nr:hypothetical protein [Bacillus cereus]PFQ72401.1 hypothetical protein COK15_28090 [Bacillus cereus]
MKYYGIFNTKKTVIQCVIYASSEREALATYLIDIETGECAYHTVIIKMTERTLEKARKDGVYIHGESK